MCAMQIIGEFKPSEKVEIEKDTSCLIVALDDGTAVLWRSPVSLPATGGVKPAVITSAVSSEDAEVMAKVAAALQANKNASPSRLKTALGGIPGAGLIADIIGSDFISKSILADALDFLPGIKGDLPNKKKDELAELMAKLQAAKEGK